MQLRSPGVVLASGMGGSKASDAEKGFAHPSPVVFRLHCPLCWLPSLAGPHPMRAPAVKVTSFAGPPTPPCSIRTDSSGGHLELLLNQSLWLEVGIV